MQTDEKRNAIRHLTFMLLFIAVVYVPFFIVLTLKYDVASVAISRIGWRFDGFRYLVSFMILTVPFMLYQVFFFIRIYGKRNKLLAFLAITGSSLIVIGGFTPYYEDTLEAVQFFHCVAAGAGAVFSFIAVTYMVAQYCASGGRQARKAAVPYGVYFIAASAAFFALQSAALFQVGLSLCSFIVMYLLNSSLVRNNIPQERKTDVVLAVS